MGADSAQTIAIIGTGLIGASVGLAALERGLASEVIGFDEDEASCDAAMARGAVTSCASSIPEAVAKAFIVVIATPVDQVSSVFSIAAQHLRDDAAVTDVASVKSSVVRQVMRHPQGKSHFVGGHPMAGSEESGPEAATGDLFEGCEWILTPTDEAEPQPLEKISDFVTALGGQVRVLDPARHDEVVALTSHLPQLLSSTLMAFVAEASKGGSLIFGKGLRDMTRLAGSSPELWTGIVRENRDAILDVVRRFRGSLDDLEGLIERGEWELLQEFLLSARRRRLQLPVNAE